MTKAIAIATTAGALALAGSAPAATPSVSITGSSLSKYAFAPRTVEISKNSSVRWAWDSNAPHNVTFKKIGAASKTGSSGTFRHRFRKKGTYKYVCTIHGFRGKVVVG